MTNGTVSLSLADIDKLRDDIKFNENKVKELEKELTETKADKRVMKVKVVAAGYGSNSYISFNTQKLKEILEYHIRQIANSPYNTKGYTDFTRIEHDIRACLTPMHSVNVEEIGKPEFINFEDAKIELNKIVEKEWQEEIGQMKSKIKHYESSISELNADHRKELATITKKYDDEEKDYRTICEEMINGLNKRIKELETGEKEKTVISSLKEEIDELKTKLAKEQSKTWLKKLFS